MKARTGVAPESRVRLVKCRVVVHEAMKGEEGQAGRSRSRRHMAKAQVAPQRLCRSEGGGGWHGRERGGQGGGREEEGGRRGGREGGEGHVGRMRREPQRCALIHSSLSGRLRLPLEGKGGDGGGWGWDFTTRQGPPQDLGDPA